MKTPTYEYRDGALVVTIAGQGKPADVHAELLAVLTNVLRGLNEGEQYDGGYLFLLYVLLEALLPTAAHLTGGWEAEDARQADQMQEEDETVSK